MKKKILLFAIMIAILTCLFVFVANAEAIKVDSTSIDMVISFYDADGNDELRTTKKVDELFNVSFKNDETEYYFKITGVKSWNVDVDGTSYSIKTQLAGLYFPEGITHMPDSADGYWGFTAATADNVRKVHLPESLQCLGGNFLRNIGYVKLVNEDDTLDNYLPSNLTSVIDHIFCYWKIVNEVIYFPEGIHNIGSSTTSSWQFEGFAPANGQITMVFLGEMNFIQFDVNEKNFTPTFVFTKNKSSDLFGYTLPMVEGSTTVASTSSYVNNTTSNQKLKLHWANNATMNTSKQTATIVSNSPYLVFCDGDNVEYVRTIRFGVDKSKYPALVDENGNGLNASGVTNYGSNSWIRFYSTPVAYDMDAHSTAGVHYNSIVYQEVNCGYDETTTNTCVICKLQSVVVGEKATGNHAYEDDFNCETALNCDVCKKTLYEALTHEISTTVVYANGYLKGGLKTVACTNEGCNNKDETELLPIFTFSGYSTNEEENAICIGYRIERESLKEYNAVNKALQFGAVASSETENILSVENDTVVGTSKTVVAEIDGDYTAFDFVLSGFDANQKGLALVMCAYVYDGENVSYMNNSMSNVPSTITLQAVIDAQKKEEN